MAREYYRTTSTKCAKLKPMDRAYIAGLIDMSGCIGIYRRGDRDCKLLNVAILITDGDVLDWLAKTTGIGKPYEVSKAKSHWKQPFRWRCCSEAAATLLKQVLPYLKAARKIQKAEALIEAQKALRPEGAKRATFAAGS